MATDPDKNVILGLGGGEDWADVHDVDDPAHAGLVADDSDLTPSSVTTSGAVSAGSVTTPDLEATGRFVTSGEVGFTPSADMNNADPASADVTPLAISATSIIGIAPTVSINITGLVAGANNQRVALRNTAAAASGVTVTVVFGSSSSSAANQFSGAAPNGAANTA